ncbi:MAG TPA: hypothetical protein ENJ01_08545 [Gammaproteobacteria bacterium]|nr:hypothetical protein [Gammaproteobacteria bacterium]
MKRTAISILAGLLLVEVAAAHDPVFGLGPHVLFKGGFETAIELHSARRGDELENELGVELTYGLTGDWAAGIELPLEAVADAGAASGGLGDISVFTKWRFWRNDMPGAQESAALLFKLIGDTGDDTRSPALGTGTTDGIVGLAWGYESRRWYRWASLRYRQNGTDANGLQRGDMMRLDLVGGIRLKRTGYLEPDMVWLLELNGEYGKRARLNGMDVANSGGTQWFVSPGIFWTYRNFAIKAGVQIPVYDDLNGSQQATDYRAQLVFEWHL